MADETTSPATGDSTGTASSTTTGSTPATLTPPTPPKAKVATPSVVEHREEFGNLTLILKTGFDAFCYPNTDNTDLDFYTHVEASLLLASDGSVVRPTQVGLEGFDVYWDTASAAAFLAEAVVADLRKALQDRFNASATTEQ